MIRSLLLIPPCCIVFAAAAFAGSPAPGRERLDSQRRFVIERTFPPGALAGLDEATKEQVNSRNSALGVHWLHSYANAARTKTYCVYEGPSEAAVRQAAAANALPVDSVTEVPLDLDPGPVSSPGSSAAASGAAPARHRFLVERSFPPGALAGLDAAGKARVNATNAALDVRWMQSFVTADQTRTFCLYEAPSEAAVREAARRNGISADRITEVPVDLTPR